MFKMDASTFEWFCEQMSPYLESTETNPSMSVVKKIAVALFRLATGANPQAAVERFGVAELEATECTTEFCQILCDHFRHLVAYSPGDHLLDITAGFEAVTGLPNCVGAIGCLHVSIQEPLERLIKETGSERPTITIVTQMAIDPGSRILSLAAGFSSALPRLRSMGLSTLYDNLQAAGLSEMPPVSIEGVDVVPYFVGDKDYELKSWLMVPFPGEELMACEDGFNRAHGRGLKVVEKMLDDLLGWGILPEVMLVHVMIAVHVVGAICVLHGMLLAKALHPRKTLDPS